MVLILVLQFDYTRLEEQAGNVEKTRDVYERALTNVPPAHEKVYWKRYVYIWLYYAVFEETVAQSVARANAIYEKLL